MKKLFATAGIVLVMLLTIVVVAYAMGGEGWTCWDTDVARVCALNTPGPTAVMYPGPESYPPTFDPCLAPYPGPECEQIVEAPVAIDEPISIQRVDEPEPTSTPKNPFEGLPRPGRSR